MARIRPSATTNDFIIVTPDVDERKPVDSANSVYVRAREDVFEDFHSFTAAIYDRGGVSTGSTPLTRNPMTSENFDGLVPVQGAAVPIGMPGPTVPNNKTVTVTGILFGGGSVSHSHDFLAYRDPSGSGSGSYALEALAALHRMRLFGSQPILSTVRLTLEGAGKISLPEPFTSDFEKIDVVYAQSGLVVGFWLSIPIRVRGGETAAFWLLRKLDATRWSLRLRWKNADVVVYHAVADTSSALFPLVMAIDPKYAKDSGWPTTVFVDPF